MKEEIQRTAYPVLEKLSMLSLVEARAVSCPVAMPHGRQTLQGGFSMLIIFEVECCQEQMSHCHKKPYVN